MQTLLKKLCDASGVGGVGAVPGVIEGELRGVADEIFTDTLGNVIAVCRSASENASTVMLEAHLDEIGFVVTEVDDQGFLRVASCGGIDTRVLAAARVNVLCDPPLQGVFCSTPPHLSDKDSDMKPLAEMGVDVGLSAEDAKKQVAIGTRVSFAPHFRALNEQLVCSKALDNRAGCAAVIEAFKKLASESVPFHVIALFAVQEEIGGGGAIAGSFGVCPDVAIVTDVSFASSPDTPSHDSGELGKGPMLGIAPGLDRALSDLAKKIARSLDIPLQFEVMGGSTGTDADKIQTSRDGVRTALLSIPQRYMHTPVEVVDVFDVKNTARLMAALAKEAVVC